MTPGDLTAVTAARAAVGTLDGRAGGLGSPGVVQRSADGDAALFTVAVSSPQDSVTSVDTRAVPAVRRAVAPAASRARDGLRVAVTGDAAVTADSGSTTLSALLLSTLVIVAVILLLVYRSPVLWLLPLITAAGAVELARALAHGLASAGLTVSYLSSAIVIVLVFGVASDYALLLVHRYREELWHHAACEQAMAAALRKTLPTLAASAATVSPPAGSAITRAGTGTPAGIPAQNAYGAGNPAAAGGNRPAAPPLPKSWTGAGQARTR